MAGLWDLYQGYGESLEDMGGGRDFFGLGSLEKTSGFDQYFRGLNGVGFPGRISTGTGQRQYSAFPTNVNDTMRRLMLLRQMLARGR